MRRADHDLLLTSLGWMNVKQLVYYDTASLMYKITDGTAPEYTQSMFNKCDTIHSYETRSVRNGNFITPEMNSAKGQTSFVYSGAQVRNSLPLRIKEARSIENIPRKIKRTYFHDWGFLTIDRLHLRCLSFFSLSISYFF